LEGDIVLYIATMATLKYFESTFKDSEFDVCMKLLSHIPRDMDEKKFFKHYDSFKVSEKKFLEIKNNSKNKFSKKKN
jgi:TBC1 domain family member 14